VPPNHSYITDKDGTSSAEGSDDIQVRTPSLNFQADTTLSLGIGGTGGNTTIKNIA
jgi:hypothetical protein